MKINRSEFLAIALSMGLGQSLSGCIIVEEQPADGTQPAQTSGQTAGGDSEGQPGGPNVVVGSQVNGPADGAAMAPADEAGMAPADEGVAAMPANECVDWDPSGECIGWAGDEQQMAPANECVEWDPSGECIGWMPAGEA